MSEVTPVKAQAAGVTGLCWLFGTAFAAATAGIAFGVPVLLTVAISISLLLAVTAIAGLAGQAATLGRLGEIEQVAFEQSDLDPRTKKVSGPGEVTGAFLGDD